ncbi:MAG: VCBS repeat-containing protein, partial [Bacteroidota bacterium]|nr:VCBS repeat-containing protein [Bacteroidota bacterium]
DIADYNNDGLPDIMNLDMMPEDNRRQKLLQLQENYESFELMISQHLQKQYMHNMLQLNNGDGTFSEISQLAGVSNTDWSWCPMFADFDNDGYKDLFITNGYLRDYTNKDFLTYRGDYKLQKAINREPFKLMDLIKAMPSTTLENYIFRNNHDLTFTNMKDKWGMNIPGISSGAIYADLDNDGDLDLVTNRINDNAAIYKNMDIEQNHSNYLAVRLQYKNPNINAVGSKIYLYNGTGKQYLEVNPNHGYLSCVSTTAHFGLGSYKSIDSLKIIWPDNTVQILKNVTGNQKLQVEYNKALTEKILPVVVTAKPVFSKEKNIIDYTNQSFDENDFKRQPLMLFMYSKTGPVIAKGDVNKDGLEDLFISGDKDKEGKIYLQQKDGTYKMVDGLNIGDESLSATSDALFFDANGDGFDDLYIAKGGYSLFEPNTPSLQDELYINDGKGNLILSKDALPDVSASSKSSVRACDYDNDGDMDLFVGGRIIPGQYPVTPTSYLLTNNGKGKFTITSVPFSHIGMVTDAQWCDINNDGRKDLILCGEFMPVSIFINTPNGFVDETKKYFDKPDNGMWFTLTIADVDGDGRPDIIAGNVGNNLQIHFSEKKPAALYYADFDNNGSIDPFLTCYVEGKSYPFVSRDELNDQIYGMRRKFTSYKDYANATMEDIFSKDELAKASKLTATESNTVCYLNRGGKFEKVILPLEAQFSVVTKIIANDFNHDGKTDLLLLGNRSDNRLKIGSIDANMGCLLQGDGKGNFTYVNQVKSGLSVKGDVKSANIIESGNTKYLMIGVADGALQFYKLN